MDHAPIVPMTQGVIAAQPDQVVRLGDQDVRLSFTPNAEIQPVSTLWVGHAITAWVGDTQVGDLLIIDIPHAHMCAHVSRIYPSLRIKGTLISPPEGDLDSYLQKTCRHLGIAPVQATSAHARLELHRTLVPALQYALVGYHARAVLDFRMTHVDRPVLDIIRFDAQPIGRLLVMTAAAWMARSGFSLGVFATDYTLKSTGLGADLPLQPVISRTYADHTLDSHFQIDLRVAGLGQDAMIAAREQGFDTALRAQESRWLWHRQRRTLPTLTPDQRARAGYFPWGDGITL